jgi:hypothetical protein
MQTVGRLSRDSSAWWARARFATALKRRERSSPKVVSGGRLRRPLEDSWRVAAWQKSTCYDEREKAALAWPEPVTTFDRARAGTVSGSGASFFHGPGAAMTGQRTYIPVTISLDESTRHRLKNIAFAAGASKTAIVVVALEEFFGRRGDTTIANKLRRGGAVKRRK